MTIALRVDFPVASAADEAALSHLHGRAFGGPTDPAPWADRLARYGVGRVGAFDDDRLVGFVHAVGDGGEHAFLLDTAVDPAYRHRGLGTALVRALITTVTDRGCRWLHVDFGPGLAGFYAGCGFAPTAAGLLRLDG